MTEKAIQSIYIIQGLVSLTTGIIIAIITPHQISGFSAGVFLVTFEFYLLYLLWKRIFAKKPVAMTALLIITKYAVLGILIFVIAKQGFSQLFAFFAGVTTLPASFLILAMKIQILEKKK